MYRRTCVPFCHRIVVETWIVCCNQFIYDPRSRNVFCSSSSCSVYMIVVSLLLVSTLCWAALTRFIYRFAVLTIAILFAVCSSEGVLLLICFVYRFGIMLYIHVRVKSSFLSFHLSIRCFLRFVYLFVIRVSIISISCQRVAHPFDSIFYRRFAYSFVSNHLVVNAISCFHLYCLRLDSSVSVIFVPSGVALSCTFILRLSSRFDIFWHCSLAYLIGLYILISYCYQFCRLVGLVHPFVVSISYSLYYYCPWLICLSGSLLCCCRLVAF